MGALEPAHIIIILVIVLVVFGPGKLPQLGKAVGDGIRELKHASREEPEAKPVGTPASAAAPVVLLAAAARTCPRCDGPLPLAARFYGTCGAAAQTAENNGVTARGSVL